MKPELKTGDLDRFQCEGAGEQSPNAPSSVSSEITGRLMTVDEKRLVLSNLIETLKFKDRLNASLVCREWRRAAIPIIHRSMKLIRKELFNEIRYWRKCYNSRIIDLEIQYFMENNLKYSQFIHEFIINYNIDLTLPYQLFTNLSHITKLTINRVDTYHQVILTWLRPLNCLKYLKFEQVYIKGSESWDEFIPVQLPPTLTTLTIICVQYPNEFDGFHETITSHTNLEKFVYQYHSAYEHGKNSIEYSYECGIFTPFFNHYPTLKKLHIIEDEWNYFGDNSCRILQSNPQLTELIFGSQHLSYKITNQINLDLTNLQVSNGQCFKQTIPPELKSIELMHSNLTQLTIGFHRHSRDLYITLFNQLSPQLTKLIVGIDWQSIYIDPFLEFNYPNLIELGLKFCLSDDDDENFTIHTYQEFIHEWNQHLSKFKQLKIINFYNFDLSYWELNSFDGLPSLEMVRTRYTYFNFQHPTPFWYKWGFTDVKEADLDLSLIRGWRVKYTINGKEEYSILYKPTTKLSIEHITEAYFEDLPSPED